LYDSKLLNSVWNKEELPDQWKESIFAPVKPVYSNYPAINFVQNFIKYPSQG
jgi:hypothetical protein